MNDIEMKNVLNHLVVGEAIAPIGKAKYQIKGIVVHIRFRSTNRTAPTKFKFNINPNVLSTDHELWVCGSSDCNYLMAIAFIKAICDNPDTYVGRSSQK